MKKLLTILMVVGMSTAFVGCGGTKTKESSDSQSSQSSESSSSTLNSEQDSAEYKVGDVISFEGEEITVTDVKRNSSTGNTYEKPKENHEFIKISVNIKNVSDKDVSISSYEFKLQNSNGAVEDSSYLTPSLEDAFDSAELVPGGSKAGSIIFEAPKGDANLKLVYEPSVLSNKKLKINL